MPENLVNLCCSNFLKYDTVQCDPPIPKDVGFPFFFLTYKRLKENTSPRI